MLQVVHYQYIEGNLEISQGYQRLNVKDIEGNLEISQGCQLVNVKDKLREPNFD